MKVSIEISLYPLTENYTAYIDAFILLFNRESSIHVIVNGMSTQLFGNLDVIWPLLQKGIEQIHSQVQASFVIKVISGIHQPEGVPDYLKQA
ncbi:MAG: hypothetical protein ACK4GL_01980 [Flavobacteriales bacterium]